MAKTVYLGKQPVGPEHPVYLIAEAGINHNGEVALAKKLISAAKEVGADAVKFQSFQTERFICKSALSAPHVDKELGVEGTFFDLLKKLELTEEDHFTLHQYATSLGIDMISTPFDERYVDLLDRLGVPFFKIASMDIDNLEFLKFIASKKKPMVVSSGMAFLSETAEALETIFSAGNSQVILLHCTSQYPPRMEEVNLKVIPTLQKAFPEVLIGYSDHTIGIHIPFAAACMGAVLIEKHFTLDKNMPGPDQQVSGDVDEFKRLKVYLTDLYQAQGKGIKQPTEGEREMKKSFRRSIVLSHPVKKGEILHREHLTLMRPGTGISPKFLPQALGRKIKRDAPAEHILSWQDLE